VIQLYRKDSAIKQPHAQENVKELSNKVNIHTALKSDRLQGWKQQLHRL